MVKISQYCEVDIGVTHKNCICNIAKIAVHLAKSYVFFSSFFCFFFPNLYQVKLRSVATVPAKLDRLLAEVDLLKSLHHPHILSLHKQWQSSDGTVFNFITEICPSGDLRGYRKMHKNVSLKAIRKWAHQILLGLNYLHAQEPCVIHRDLKCSNIFVKGNIGQVQFFMFVNLEWKWRLPLAILKYQMSLSYNFFNFVHSSLS